MATRNTRPHLAPTTPQRATPSALVDHHRIVVGYHGCDRAVGERALLGQEGLTWSRNRYDWLGHGIYFWEHGPQRALDWAKETALQDQHKPNPRIRHPFVIGSYIYLGRCLDLTDTHHTHRLKKFFDLFSNQVHHDGQTLPTNRPAFPSDTDLLFRDLDCALINYIHEHSDAALEGTGERLYYQTVRGAFHEGEPAFPGSGLRSKTHIQIAVRDEASIIGYFKPNLGALP